MTEFAPRFIEWARAERQNPSTIVAKESVLRVHLVPLVGDKRLDELEPPNIQALEAPLQDRNVKDQQ